METFKLNELVVGSLNYWANSSLYYSNLVIFFGVYLGWVMLGFLFVYVYRAHRRWAIFRFVFVALASALTALFIADLIKTWYPIDRPNLSLKEIVRIFIPGDLESFPSSHMTFFSGLAFSLMWRKRHLGLWFLVGAILIGLARIAAGIHYPLDIIAGGLLGFVVSLFFRRFLATKSSLK